MEQENFRKMEPYNISGLKGDFFYLEKVEWETFGNKEFYKFINKNFNHNGRLESVLVVSIPVESQIKVENKNITVDETDKILSFFSMKINPLLRQKRYFNELNKMINGDEK